MKSACRIYISLLDTTHKQRYHQPNVCMHLVTFFAPHRLFVVPNRTIVQFLMPHDINACNYRNSRAEKRHYPQRNRGNRTSVPFLNHPTVQARFDKCIIAQCVCVCMEHKRRSERHMNEQSPVARCFGLRGTTKE